MQAKVLQSGLSREVYPLNETRATKLRMPSEEAKNLPFYWLLPEDHLLNIKWRIYARERALRDHEFRDNLLYMCQQDVCFFIETICTVFEPRPPRPLPLKLWLDQVDVLAWADECYGRRDMGIEKSRGIGASWIFAMFLYHKWLFYPSTKIAVMTKDEDSLDGKDENSFLGKIEFLHKHVPAWLRHDSLGRNIMQKTGSDHMVYNTRNGASIQGFVPTDNKVRSLRFSSMFFDEFAFLTRDVQANMNSSSGCSNNRYFVSTWNGPGNTFHHIMRRQESTLLRVEMYWWNNTERYQGAYTSENGVLKILDKDYRYPKDYPYILDGRLRSPWIDFELRRAGCDELTALQEYYGLQSEDSIKLFRGHAISVIEATAKLPEFEGDLIEQSDGPVFMAYREGPIKLWKPLGDLGNGNFGPFSAGCDLSFGRGATYSTLEVIDLQTGEQVLEYAVNDQKPVEFAQSVVNILRWMNCNHGDGRTYLSFENNGDQAKTFLDEILRLGYRNVMKRKYSAKLKTTDATRYYGLRNRDGGLANMSSMERGVIDGELTIRSPWLLEEMKLFVKDDNGKPEFPKNEKGHGDRTQGAGVAWIQAVERGVSKRKGTKTEEKQLGERVPKEKNTSWQDSWSLKSSNPWGL